MAQKIVNYIKSLFLLILVILVEILIDNSVYLSIFMPQVIALYISNVSIKSSDNIQIVYLSAAGILISISKLQPIGSFSISYIISYYCYRFCNKKINDKRFSNHLNTILTYIALLTIQQTIYIITKLPLIDTYTQLIPKIVILIAIQELIIRYKSSNR